MNTDQVTDFPQILEIVALIKSERLVVWKPDDDMLSSTMFLQGMYLSAEQKRCVT